MPIDRLQERLNSHVRDLGMKAITAYMREIERDGFINDHTGHLQSHQTIDGICLFKDSSGNFHLCPLKQDIFCLNPLEIIGGKIHLKNKSIGGSIGCGNSWATLIKVFNQEREKISEEMGWSKDEIVDYLLY